MTNETKRCPKCGEEKPLDAFGRNTDKRDGLMGHCKACERVQKQRRYSTPEGRARASAATIKSTTKRRKNDPWFRLKEYLANRTNDLVGYLVNGTGRTAESMGSYLDHFGKTRQEVFAYIDDQLKTRGFDWPGYGKQWVLDHRLPLAMAQSNIELYQLCLLENCQVLTPEENASKRIEDVKLIRQYESEV